MVHEKSMWKSHFENRLLAYLNNPTVLCHNIASFIHKVIIISPKISPFKNITGDVLLSSKLFITRGHCFKKSKHNCPETVNLVIKTHEDPKWLWEFLFSMSAWPAQGLDSKGTINQNVRFLYLSWDLVFATLDINSFFVTLDDKHPVLCL